MLGDKIFKFKKEVDDADFFAAFKAQFRVLNDFLEDNETQIQQLAQQLGRALANTVRATADAILFVKQNLEIFINVIRVFIGLAFAKIVLALGATFIKLAASIKVATLAMIKFNAATRRNLLLVAGAVVFGNLDKIIKGLKNLGRTLGITSNDFDEFFDDANAPMPLRNIEEANKKLTMMQQILGKVKEAFNQAFGKSTKDRLKEFGGIVKKAFEGITKSIGDAVAQTIVFGKSFKDTLRAALQQVLAQFISGLVTMGIQIILNTQLIRKFGKAIAGAMGGGTKTGFNLGSVFDIGRKVLGFAEGGRIRAGQPAIVGERGRELFIPQTSGTIVPNEQMGMGGANINFTIVANDTRDFDKLLIERRSTITNLINQALNQQGRVGLV